MVKVNLVWPTRGLSANANGGMRGEESWDFMGKYLSERPVLDAEWKMDPSKCRNELNVLWPLCCTCQHSVSSMCVAASACHGPDPAMPAP